MRSETPPGRAAVAQAAAIAAATAPRPAMVERQAPGDDPRLRGFVAMGGPCELLIDDDCGEAERDAATAAARAEVARIEAKYSRYRADSLIGRINAAAGTGEPVALDAETAALIDFGALLHAQSEGRFDLTSGVLRRAWDFRRAEPPTPAAVAAAHAQVGWHKVGRDDRGLWLAEAGMELDLGGIGKEYAADRVATLLAARGLRHGWVNLAGDIRVLGPRRDGTPWRFGIQHPRAPAALTATLALVAGAVATSGDYERCIEHAGRRWCHILDATTGWPVSHWQSVSVAAPTCTAAGALSTLAMLAGADATALLDGQGVDWLAIDAEGRLHRPT